MRVKTPLKNIVHDLATTPKKNPQMQHDTQILFVIWKLSWNGNYMYIAKQKKWLFECMMLSLADEARLGSENFCFFLIIFKTLDSYTQLHSKWQCLVSGFGHG